MNSEFVLKETKQPWTWMTPGKQPLQVFAVGNVHAVPTHLPSPSRLSLLSLLDADVRGERGSIGGGQGRAIDTRPIVSQRPPFRVI